WQKDKAWFQSAIHSGTYTAPVDFCLDGSGNMLVVVQGQLGGFSGQRYALIKLRESDGELLWVAPLTYVVPAQGGNPALTTYIIPGTGAGRYGITADSSG